MCLLFMGTERARCALGLFVSLWLELESDLKTLFFSLFSGIDVYFQLFPLFWSEILLGFEQMILVFLVID